MKDHIEISTELQQMITAEQAWHYKILPKSRHDHTIAFYSSEANNLTGIVDELEVLFGLKVECHQIDNELLLKSLGKYYRRTRQDNNTRMIRGDSEGSKDLLLHIILEANETGCSDIHIETYGEKCRVRTRIDGKLIERYILNKEDYPALVNKIKIMANLDIAEKRLPQDGRIFIDRDPIKFDIRVSVLPTLYGEKIVLRLLSKDATHIDISSLGFDEQQLKTYLEGIRKTHGIILISGPTGSGKTTTLYATLKILNNIHSNILTIEDPIEYTLEGINQVQLKESIGLTYPNALRTFLRQDPDIIMLGEIRDKETAQMAIRAALTGHLVLSTIHTNSAHGTFSRMIDLGVPAFLIAGTLILSVAQRLVRLLCPVCKTKTGFHGQMFPAGYRPPASIKEQYIPVGCEDCFYTGYKGRKAIYEIIAVNREITEMIKTNNFDNKQFIQKINYDSLADLAFTLFESGSTSLEEIYSILANSV